MTKRKKVYDERAIPICPYCHHSLEEWWKYFDDQEDGMEDIECPYCKKYFICEISWSPLFSTYTEEDI